MHDANRRDAIPGGDGFLIARSSFESHMYMRFHPCVCGDGGPVALRLERRGAHALTVYDGACNTCGRPKYFEFAVSFDDEARSTILDAGQWLLSAEWVARGVPADLAQLNADDRILAVTDLERAVIALEETLKFIPPGGDRVLEEALWSPEGKALYAGEPGRFRRPRIEAVLAVYRDSLARLAD